MKELKEAKKRYDSIEIPPELSETVQEAIKTSEEKMQVIKREMNQIKNQEKNQEVNQVKNQEMNQEKNLEINRVKNQEITQDITQEKLIYLNNVNGNSTRDKRRSGSSMSRKHIVLKTVACVAVVVVGGFTVALNSSETFAATVSNLPVIESIAKVLTFRNYSYQDADKEVTVEIPQVVVKEDSEPNENEDYIAQINQMIQEKVDDYVKMAEENIAEYKEAFLATGGTEEEFTDKDIKVDVSYNIKSETQDMVSFVLTANENWSSAYNVNYYYNLNLADGKEITLNDMLGEDYIQLANEQIIAQMEERMAADENISYFDEDMGGFQTISDTTNFYINEAGNPVVVFAKYEIAPGAMGVQEFEIVK